MQRPIIVLCTALATSNMAWSKSTIDDSSIGLFADNSSLQISPYVWAADLKGTISPFRYAPEIKTKKSFSDIVKDLRVAGFLNLRARHKDLVISSDIIYVNVKESRAIGPFPAFAPPLPAIPAIKGSVDTSQLIVSLLAGMRLYHQDQLSVDLLAGARLWSIRNTVTLQSHRYSARYKENFHWVDPIIGTRVFYKFTDHLSLQAQADIGGFDVGADFSWSLFSTLNYQLNRNLSVSAGYKVLSTNYQSGGNRYDVRMKGPVVGMTYRF